MNVRTRRMDRKKFELQNKQMRTNNQYIFREIGGESLLIPIGQASVKLNGMIHMSETAAFIWQQVDKAADLNEIIKALTEEYDVTEEQARTDVYGYLTELHKRGMVLEIPELENSVNSI